MRFRTMRTASWLAGCFGVLLDREGHVMCSTDAALARSDEMLDAIRKSVSSNGAQVRRVGDQYYAFGSRLDSGLS